MLKWFILAALATLLAAPPPPLAAQDSLVRSLSDQYAHGRDLLMATAELLDAELYAYRPAEEVRSSGQILAHIANSQLTFCALAAGEERPTTEYFEDTRTTKPEILDALEQGFSYCDQVFNETRDADLPAERTLFETDTTVLGVLVFNLKHNDNHYGNLVTYMRLNGIVPPSSRPPGG